jgi:hypothetical protein
MESLFIGEVEYVDGDPEFGEECILLGTHYFIKGIFDGYYRIRDQSKILNYTTYILVKGSSILIPLHTEVKPAIWVSDDSFRIKKLK